LPFFGRSAITRPLAARLIRAAVAASKSSISTFVRAPGAPGVKPRRSRFQGEPNAQDQDQVGREEALQDHRYRNTGKVLAAMAGKRHGMIKRTNKQIRDHRGTRVLFKTDGDNIRKYFLPNG
jgi:large subunit ribosomal protein L35